MEEWRPIECATNYEVSSLGKVRNKKTKNILSGTVNNKGYIRYDLSINGKRKAKSGHRLVAEAFIAKVNGKTIINHKDGNKTNNNVDNLEWCNNKENSVHAFVKLGNEPVNKKAVRCIETGVEYKSCREAARATGISNSLINRCCNKRRRSACGTHWELVVNKLA